MIDTYCMRTDELSCQRRNQDSGVCTPLGKISHEKASVPYRRKHITKLGRHLLKSMKKISKFGHI